MMISLPSLHPSQRVVRDSEARFKVLACGRRWGKTRLGSAMCIKVAGDGGRAWWVGPSYKMAMVGWRLISNMSVQIPGAVIRQGEKLVTLPGGGTIQIRSADDPDSLRGEGLDLAVLDECAFMKEDAWKSALRPALSDRRGDAVFISTPKGRNWFWRLWQAGIQGGEWQSWRFPTSDNPYIDPAEIEAAKTDLPELIFEQEYMAVFLESEGYVFRNILACMNAPETTPEEHEGHRIVAGIDWGKQSDFTAISIGCVDCKQEIARDRFNKIDYSFQRGKIMVLLDKWGVTNGLAETNAMGAPILEQLQRDGARLKGFETTASSKSPLIENLALVLEREEWQFQSDDIWSGELEAYERKVSPVTGRSQYSAPDGMHDDTVIARALMVKAGDTARGVDLIAWV